MKLEEESSSDTKLKLFDTCANITVLRVEESALAKSFKMKHSEVAKRTITANVTVYSQNERRI